MPFLIRPSQSPHGSRYCMILPPTFKQMMFYQKTALQIIWEIVWRASRPDSPCDGRSFSEKFSCDVHMTFMFGNKPSKGFQHFLFFVAVIFHLVLWLSKWYMHRESKSAVCFDAKDGNRLPVPHSFPNPTQCSVPWSRPPLLTPELTFFDYSLA